MVRRSILSRGPSLIRLPISLASLRPATLSSLRHTLLCHPERSEGSALVASSLTFQLRAGSERSEGSALVLSFPEQIPRRCAPRDDKAGRFARRRSVGAAPPQDVSRSRGSHFDENEFAV